MGYRLLIMVLVCTALAAFVKAGQDEHEVRRIKTVHNYLSNTDCTYIYLPDGRLSKTDDSYFNRIQYTYVGDSIIYYQYFNNERTWQTDTFEVNNKGLIEKYLNGKYTATYNYNADGFLIGYTRYYNGKLIEKNVRQITSEGNMREITYDYTKSKTKPDSTIVISIYNHTRELYFGERSDGENFWGKSIYTPCLREIYLDSKGDTVKNETSTYVYDITDYCIRWCHYFTNGQISDSVGYTYY